MTDIFAQQGINFMSSSMASTAPSANPAPITAPKIDMGNAPSNQNIPQIDASSLDPSATVPKGGVIAPPSAPDQSTVNLAGNSGPGVSAAAGAAPPQPQAQPGTGKDIFAAEGITAPNGQSQPQSPFSRGVTFGAGQAPAGPEAAPVVDYATQVAQQTQSFAALRFTPQQIKAYVNSPTSLSEAIQNQDQFPDAAALVQKYQSGEPLSEDQNNRLGDFVDATLKAGLRGVGWDGNKAVIDPKLPASLVQYIQSGTAGKLPPGDGGEPQQYQNGSSIVPPPYAPKVGEKPINDYAAVTDKGQELMKAAQSAPASTALKTVQFNDLPIEVKSALYDSMVIHDPNAKITDLMTQQGYTKAIDMLGEKQASSIISNFMASSGRVLKAGTGAFSEAVDTTDNPPGFSPEFYNSLGLNQDPKNLTELAKQVPASIASGAAGMADMGLRTMSGVFGGVIAAGGQAAREMGASDTTSAQLERDANDLLMSEAGRAGVNIAEDASRSAYNENLKALTSTNDQAMVKSGIVSIDGAKSDATQAAEGILTAKGIDPVQAAETVDNMTAREKDSFVAKNAEVPRSAVPTLAETVSPKDIPEHIQAQLLPDEPPPSGNTDADIINSQTAATNAANPPVIPEEQSSFNQQFAAFKAAITEKGKSIYAELFNDLQPIEDLAKIARDKGAALAPGEDMRLLANFAKSTPAWIERNWTTDTTEFDRNGNQIITGKGLKTIRDEFDSIFSKTEPDWKVRQDDMDAYRQARTFMEDKAKNLSNVSEKDLMRSVADLQRLSDKYGDNFKFFDTFGRQEVQWNNRILHNLVSSGLKSQEWYDHTVSQREWYSPTQRVIEEDPEMSSMLVSKQVGKDVTPSRIGALKQRKGSDLEVKNTFQSQLRNSAIILEKSAANKLRLQMKNFSEFFPDEVKYQRPAVIREAVEHSFDPKLRAKLEQVADFLGGEVKREVPEGVKKRTLGHYDPNDKSIFVRPGTTEGTLTHEIGHMLDYAVGLKDKLLKDPEIKVELQKLAEDRLRSEISLQKTPDGMTEFAEKLERAPKSFENYLKNDDEVLANFFDTWVHNPERLAKDAPKAKEAFEKILDDNPQLSMLRDVRPSTSRETEVLQRELLDQRGPKNSIPVYENGARGYLVLSKPLARAFSTMTPMEIGLVQHFMQSILGASTKLLKAGATSLPEFMLKHFYRAVFTSFLNNPAEKGILGIIRHVGVGLPRGIFAVLGKNELYTRWSSSSGALRTYLDLSDKALAKKQAEFWGNQSLANYLNPIKWFDMYKTTKEISDYAPRIAVFKSLIDRGVPDLEAGLMSLEATGNYTRHGDLSRRVNNWAPFFNDMVQGGDRFVRSQMKSPAAFAVKALSTVTIPQLMLTGYYLYGADDQTRKEYLNIPDFDRSMAMCLKIGDQWVKLPRAFAPGFVYGALTEKAMVYAYAQSHDNAPQIKNWWLKTIAEAATSVSPVFDWTRAITPMFKAWMEATTNYSLFMHRPLFTGDMEKTMPMDQSNQYTTETAKMIGKLFDFSPIDVDNTVYDMAGKAGRFAEQLSDHAINAYRSAQGQPVNERETRPADSPLYGGLVMDVPRGTNTESYQEFLSNLHEAEQAHSHEKSLTGPDQAEYDQSNGRLLSAYQSVQATNNEINKLQKQIRTINSDTNLSGQNKTTQINQLQDMIGRMVEQANVTYRAATGEQK